jgi:hypothetical protein
MVMNPEPVAGLEVIVMLTGLTTVKVLVGGGVLDGLYVESPSNLAYVLQVPTASGLNE